MHPQKMPRSSHLLAVVLLAATALAALSACEKRERVLSPVLAWNNCSGCHSNGAQILATAEPDEGNGEATPGEG